VVDSVSFPATRGYAPISVQPAGNAAPVSAPATAPDQGQVKPAVGAPSLTLDFSQGLAAGYVLDWRDPITNQVLVQIPMRTAFQQFSPPSGTRQTGKTVDTEA
jgi:hypothetical protein